VLIDLIRLQQSARIKYLSFYKVIQLVIQKCTQIFVNEVITIVLGSEAAQMITKQAPILLLFTFLPTVRLSIALDWLS